MVQMGLMTRLLMTVRPALLGVAIAPDADPAEVAGELQRRGELPVAVPASPLMHSTGLYVSFPTLLAGGSVVTLEKRSFDSARAALGRRTPSGDDGRYRGRRLRPAHRAGAR
jgi:hypothetical protein